MRAPLIALAAAAMAVAVSAPAWGSGRPAEVAAAIARDPVYVAPVLSSDLPSAGAARVRALIREADPDRIRIAVIPQAWAQQEGGAGPFANAVDAAGTFRGALVVLGVTSTNYDIHIITSHDHSDEAVSGVDRAFNGGGSLESHLRRSVRALAGVDPGPSGDAGGGGSGGMVTPTFTFPDANRIVKDVGDTIRFTVIAIILATLAPFAFIGWRFWRAGRRRREEDVESFADARAATEQEREALGEDIVDLDVPTSMPDVPADARAAYERALDAYDRTELALKRADSPRRLAAVRDQVRAGRRDAAIARRATGGNAGTPG